MDGPLDDAEQIPCGIADAVVATTRGPFVQHVLPQRGINLLQCHLGTRRLFEKPYSWISRHFFGIGEEKIAVPATVGTGKAALGLGEWLRKVQTGNTSFYLFGMMVGVVVLLIITLFGV